MCGMEESTVNLLMANMAYKLGKVDIASRFISMILTSQAASRVAKDRAIWDILFKPLKIEKAIHNLMEKST